MTGSTDVRVRLKGIKKVRTRGADGQRVEYHYVRGGARFWKTGDSPIGSPEYVAAFQAASSRQTEKNLAMLIRRYSESGDFRKLKPRTQADYQIWLARLESELGDAPVEALNDHRIRAEVMKWRDKWSGRQSDYAWTVARRVFGWAYDGGMISQHHLRQGGVRYKSDRAGIVWTPADVGRFMAEAPPAARRAMTAALETGLRPGDLIRLSRAHIEPTPQGRRIRIRTNKRGRLAVIPITPDMARIIDETPAGRMLILTTQNNRAFTEQRISQYLNYWARKAGVNLELRLQDARGTAATKLLLAGADLGELAATFGWSLRYASQVIENYAQAAPEVSDAVLIKLTAFSK